MKNNNKVVFKPTVQTRRQRKEAKEREMSIEIKPVNFIKDQSKLEKLEEEESLTS